MSLIFCYDLEWFQNWFCTLSQQLWNMQHHITILHCHNSAQSSCVRYCHNYIYSHTNHRVMKRHFKGHSAGESKLSGHLFESLLFLQENLGMMKWLEKSNSSCTIRWRPSSRTSRLSVPWIQKFTWQMVSYSFHPDRLSWRLGRCRDQSTSHRPPGCLEWPYMTATTIRLTAIYTGQPGWANNNTHSADVLTTIIYHVPKKEDTKQWRQLSFNLSQFWQFFHPPRLVNKCVFKWLLKIPQRLFKVS